MKGHHLILLREVDQQITGGSCCQLSGTVAFFDPGACVFPERRETMNRIGEIYRAVRDAFPDEVDISILDPRNVVSYVPLIVRDALRHRVPVTTAVRALTAPGLAAGIFDAQVLFSGDIPMPRDVVETIAGRLEVARVGSA